MILREFANRQYALPTLTTSIQIPAVRKSTLRNPPSAHVPFSTLTARGAQVVAEPDLTLKMDKSQQAIGND
jgi:hypothetical protein